MSVTEVELLEEMFSQLQPMLWTANFKDGKTLNSNMMSEFTKLSLEQKSNITALRMQDGKSKFTISRKVDGKLVSGFFYYIRAGKAGVMGLFQGRNIPFMEERIGFCYNSNGDAMTIRINHDAFIAATYKKWDKMMNLAYKYLDWSVERLENAVGGAVKYSAVIKDFRENIAGKDFFADGMPTIKTGSKHLRNSFAVNIALFGRLEYLDELGIPPHVKIDSEESVIASIHGNSK